MGRALLLAATAAGAAVLFAAGLGLGAGAPPILKLSTRLDARHETPAPKGAVRAAGLFTATLSGRSLTWKLVYSGLTGKPVAAHIHLGRPGVAGPVAVPLCGPCLSGTHGTVIVTPRVRGALAAGTAYVNVHTVPNPAGEIRGQLGRPSAPLPAGSTTSAGYGGYR